MLDFAALAGAAHVDNEVKILSRTYLIFKDWKL
jgi:hypothetical protein